MGPEDAPTAQTRAASAAAAAAAAAAARRAQEETEVLTSTYVEVVPPESRWGEQFTLAVHRDSTVGDIRRAVWTEMNRRGLGPRRSSPSGGGSCGYDDKEGGGEGGGPPPRSPSPVQEWGGVAGAKARPVGHPLEAEGEADWTPAALRLRERQVKLPATIVRDAPGKVARLRSRPNGAPWLLAAQVLPRGEHLGRPAIAAGAGADGGDSGDSGANGSSPTAGGVGGGAEEAVSFAPPAEDAKVIVVQWWNRFEWRLTERYEAWISPSETVAEARRRLAEEVWMRGNFGQFRLKF